MVDENEQEDELEAADIGQDLHLPKPVDDPLSHEEQTFYRKYLAPETTGELFYWIVLLLVVIGLIGFLVVGYSQMGK